MRAMETTPAASLNAGEKAALVLRAQRRTVWLLPYELAVPVCLQRLFGFSGFFGSMNETNKMNQTNQPNKQAAPSPLSHTPYALLPRKGGVISREGSASKKGA